MPDHPFHKKVADSIDDIIKTSSLSLTVEKDEACGGSKHLPFFISFHPSRESVISNVDLIILKDDKIILVCEIEESGFNPTKLFGKIFTTASAKVCRLNERPNHKYLLLDENALFLQIIDNQSFQRKSIKKNQGELIENEIFHKLNNYGSWIKNYRLLFGTERELNITGELYKEIERILLNL